MFQDLIFEAENRWEMVENRQKVGISAENKARNAITNSDYTILYQLGVSTDLEHKMSCRRHITHPKACLVHNSHPEPSTMHRS